MIPDALLEKEEQSIDWTIEDAREMYNIAQWGDGFFNIDQHGNVVVYPTRNQDQGVSLTELVKELKKAGLCPPILIRFTDILHQRFNELQKAFAMATNAYEYKGRYTSVYPIKVNQQRHVVESITRLNNIGLEAGSKPELMAVLALSDNSPSLIICNGYKDREYIRLALIGQRLGHQVYIILEKLSELDLVLQEANLLNITPNLGIRIRLAGSSSSSKWHNSGGEKSKFGFSATHLLRIIERLKLNNKLSILKLVHFHIGSQVANITDIQRSMRECARHYVELRKANVNIEIVDVGGGLAVDYEGTHSRRHCSMNYTIQEYANNIIYTLADICNEKDIPHPNIITESGRAMTAHHAVLITNVIEVEESILEEEIYKPAEQDPQILHDMWSCYTTLTYRSAVESYHDVCQWMNEAQTMYVHGLLTLIEKAKVEQFYKMTCLKVKSLLKNSVRFHRDIIDELNEKLASKYFCNFSLFQSLPDAWAINQIFPVMPISSLTKKPNCRATLHDLTCDSDGCIKHYVDSQGVETTLPLPSYPEDKPFLVGIFLVGAYQEILGDMHNLFGDTDSVHVEIQADNNYRLIQPLQGSTVEEVLRYVQFDTKDLMRSYRFQLGKANISEHESQQYLQEFLAGLNGYTYLED